MSNLRQAAFLPDAFALSILLTIVTFAVCAVITAHSVPDLLTFWFEGLWSLLAFSMQIALLILAGHAVASAPAVLRALHFIANRAKTSSQAIVMVTLVGTASCWINPAFGLVAGALFAKAVGDCVPQANYGLLIASSYSGYVTWHAGLSGMIPLQLASPGDDSLGELIGNPVPMSETVFSSGNLGLCAVLFLTLPMLNVTLGKLIDRRAGVKDTRVEVANSHPEPPAQVHPDRSGLGQIAIASSVVVISISYFAIAAFDEKAFGLNEIILVFIALGLILHRSPEAYSEAIKSASSVASGVMLQYPFYGGIMGLMSASGAAALMTASLIDVSSPETFPLYTFLSAGLINMFIPSGGGQWAIQAPVVVEAARALGVPISTAAMAVAYGDSWTNLAQPFWAIPVLSIAGLQLRDIYPYCLAALVWSGVVFSGFLLFFV